MTRKLKHIISPGDRFGRLEVIGEMEGAPLYMRCQCDCGNVVSIPRMRLISGSTKSCGCLKREVSKVRLEEYRKKVRENNRERYDKIHELRKAGYKLDYIAAVVGFDVSWVHQVISRKM